MRLNDPQIKLVHDDPFMGYIETAPTQADAGTAVSIRRRAPLDSIVDGDDIPSAVDDDVDEDVDVGDESSRHSVPPSTPQAATDAASTSDVRPIDGTATSTVAATSTTDGDQSIVIVLLVE